MNNRISWKHRSPNWLQRIRCSHLCINYQGGTNCLLVASPSPSPRKPKVKPSQWCQFKQEYNMICKMVYWLLVFLGRKVDVGHKPRLYKILSNVKIKCWCQYRNKLRIDSLLCLELTPCFKPNSFLKNGPILASFSVYFRLFNMSKLKLLKV